MRWTFSRLQVLRRPDELDFPLCVDHRRKARRRAPEEAGVVTPWRLVRGALDNIPVIFGGEASVLFHMLPWSLSLFTVVMSHVNYIS